jgi:serine/threonine protein kinase
MNPPTSHVYRPSSAIPYTDKPKAANNTSDKAQVPAVIVNVKRDLHGIETKKQYVRGELLGKGGFAKCFKVFDTDTHKEWACKVVHKASLVKERHKAKLQAEVKIHKSLHHPHIVRFEDVFEDTENVYILMELCPNQTMMELVKRKKRLSESETKRFIIQLVSCDPCSFFEYCG